MTTESAIEVLRAWLKSQDLQLCTLTSEPMPLDGEHETQALRGVVDLFEDFREEEPTKEIEPKLLANYVAASQLA